MSTLTVNAASASQPEHYPHWRGSALKVTDPLTPGQEKGLKRLVSKLKQMDVKEKIQAGRQKFLRQLWLTQCSQGTAGWNKALKLGFRRY